MDNSGMTAAGGKAASAHGNKAGQMSDVFGLGSKFDYNAPKPQRDPLSTHDINGEKINRFGQKLKVEARLAGQSAGQQKGSLNAQY